MILEELYCLVEISNQGFMEGWAATLIQECVCKKGWECQTSASEITTIMVLFHQKNYRALNSRSQQSMIGLLLFWI